MSPPSAIDWQGKRKTEWQRQYPVEQQGGCSGTPQHTLPGISIAADAECSRPKVHKSLTGGKYCSCDEGKAVNWKEALGEAQAQVEKVMKPKLDALHSAVSELEESLGIEIDEFLVRRFPRKAGQGLWPQASARKMLRWSPDSGAAAFTTRHRCELVRRSVVRGQRGVGVTLVGMVVVPPAGGPGQAQRRQLPGAHPLNRELRPRSRQRLNREQRPRNRQLRKSSSRPTC